MRCGKNLPSLEHLGLFSKMWTEIKYDGLENDESIWVMLLEIENHMSLRSLFRWNGFVFTQMGMQCISQLK
eukprot:10164450-Ditylum_brightwellii.AAC.1